MLCVFNTSTAKITDLCQLFPMKNILSLVVALAAIVSLSAAPTSVSNKDSAYGTNKPVTRSSIGRMSEPVDPVGVQSGPVGYPTLHATNVWLELPYADDPAFPALARAAINEVLAGRLPANNIQVLEPRHLTKSLGLAPYNLWVVRCFEGFDTSLAEIQVYNTCEQDAGLNETRTFLPPRGYSSTAVGFRNGELLESGASDIRVTVVALLVPTKTYTDTLEVVTKWIEVDNNNRFGTKQRLLIPEKGSTFSTLSTVGYNALIPSGLVVTPIPAGQVTLDDGTVLDVPSGAFVGVNGYNGRSYTLWVGNSDKPYEPNLLIGNVSGTEQVFVPGEARFFRFTTVD